MTLRIIFSTLFLFVFSSEAKAQSEWMYCALYARVLQFNNEESRFTPGVDVHGNPVTAANLPGGETIAFPPIMSFPLDVNLANRLGLAEKSGVEMTTNLGKIDIYNDGRVSVNGEDISEQTLAMCRNEQVELPESVLQQTETEDSEHDTGTSEGSAANENVE